MCIRDSRYGGGCQAGVLTLKEFILSKNMDNRELNLMISVIKKYYELGMNQEQIAKEEFISKSSVCRLIKKAQDNGFVSYKINYPMESIRSLENEFHKRFKLNKVFITPAYTEDTQIRLQDTCRSVADDICKIIRASDSIGISWGTTMEQEMCIRERWGKASRRFWKR